ncbi:MAG: hypothetical protein JEZ06_15460 [Anaerolineaceae bacterium]|nr:hypothetical protein [Anaerolineaceae bacterium]
MDIAIIQLQEIQAARERIRFFNVYQGIPISYTGEVLEVFNRTAMFKIHSNQILSMLSDKRTYLQNRRFSQTVKARIIDSSMDEEIVTLGNFEFTDNKIGKRMHIRVVPKDPTRVQVTNLKQEARGDLIEISIRGLSITMNATLYDTRFSGYGKNIYTSLKLSEPGLRLPQITLPGTIKNVILKKKEHLVRIGIQTFPEKDVDKVLSKYIARRQNQIVQEIKRKTSKDHVISTDEI